LKEEEFAVEGGSDSDGGLGWAMGVLWEELVTLSNQCYLITI
jgi:hypothetical protein